MPLINYIILRNIITITEFYTMLNFFTLFYTILNYYTLFYTILNYYTLFYTIADVMERTTQDMYLQTFRDTSMPA